jgi:signal transduction histidine kinase
MGESEPVGHDALAQQQRRILGTFVVGLALAALLVSPILWFQAEDRRDPRLWTLLTLSQGFVAVYMVRRRLSYRALALSLLGLLGAISGFGASLRGPTPGSMALHSMALLLAALFFGKRGAWLVLAGCMATVLLAGVLLTQGYVVPWYTAFWNPLLPVVWLRYAVLLTILTGTTALAYTQVVQGLTDTARMLSETLQRERNEREQRERAQAELERAQRHELLAQLAAGIAHDMANSLMVVSVHAEFISIAPSVSGEVAQDAANIIDTMVGIKAQLARLLALGRAESRDFAPVRLDAPLAWLDKTLRRVLPENIVLRTHVAVADAIAVDAPQLEQALLNLGLNARDAMPQGGHLDYEVSACALEAAIPGWDALPGRFVRISCRDDGSGMDVATQQRIFEPFFTTKQPGPGRGTGLGLPMVRRLVYDAKGYISVESRVGAGTVFHLHFPISVTVSQPDELATSAGPSSGPAPADDTPEARARELSVD